MELSRKISICLLICLLLCPLVFAPFLLDQHLAIRSLILCVGLLIGYYFLADSQLISDVRIDLLLLAKMVYPLICVASILWAANKAEAFYSASKDLLGLLFFAACLFVLNLDKNFFLNAVFKIMLVLLTATGIVLAIQFLKADRTNPEWIYNLTGLNAHKNLCASFLFLILFILGCAIENKDGVWKKVFQAAFLICLVCIFFIRSKAAIVGLGISAITYLLTLKNAKQTGSTSHASIKIPLVVFAGTLLFFLLVFPLLLNTSVTGNGFMSKIVSLDSERWILWQKSYAMFWKSLWLGVGAGNWQIFFPAEGLQGIWRSEDLNVSFQRPHNDFLWILCEKGLVGFTAFMVFIAGLIYSLSKIRKPAVTAPDQSYSRFFLPALTGWLVISFCDFPAERIEHIIFSNLIFALGYQQVRKYLPSIRRIKVNNSIYFILTLVLIFCTIISWKRVTGEKNTRDMYAAKTEGNLNEMNLAAENALSFAYDLDPTSIPIRWYTGSAAAAKGDFKNSLFHFMEAYEAHPFQRNVLNDLGTAYVLNAQPATGKTFYTMATIISPRFDDAKLNLAALAINEKQYAFADRWLKSVLHDSEKRKNYERVLFIETEGKLGSFNKEE